MSSESDQRPGWKLTQRRGRSRTPGANETLERSPSKLTRLFRGISDSVVPTSGPSSGPAESPEEPSTSTDSQNGADNRRNAVILDFSPDRFKIRPPSIAESVSTSRFSLVSPPSPPADTLLHPFVLHRKASSDQTDTLIRSSSKRFLPKFKAGKTPFTTPTKPTRLFSLRKKSKHVSYESNGEPLDGEEGELIDDEACFMDPFVARGMDILRMLPDELSLYILLFVDIPEILACQVVSRHWQRLANDNIIWRAFYYRAGFGIDTHAAQQAGINLQSTANLASTPTSSQPGSPISRLTFYVSPYTPSLYPSVASFSTHQSHESHVQFTRTAPSLSLAPLSLDWKSMYKTRLDIEERLLAMEPTLTSLSDHTEAVYCVELNGETLVTGSRDRTIRVWALRKGKPKCKMVLTGHKASVLCLQLDHTGFMVSGSSDWTIIVWNLNAEGDNRVVDVLREHRGGVLDIKMDSKWIVSCSKDTRICIWDRQTRALHRTLTGHDGPVNAVGIKDDKVASVSGDGKMILWDINSGEQIRIFGGHDRGLACVEFKGDYLISGSNDKKIKIWNPWTADCIKTLSAHDHLVRALSFDPGTMRLVSTSYDRSIKIWDVSTGKLLRVFQNVHDSHIFDVVFHVSKIISASHDRKVVIMDFATDLDASLFA